MVTSKADSMSDVVYANSDWYRHSSSFRLHIIMMMRYMQQSLHLYGLDLVAFECSLGNFADVSRAISLPITINALNVIP